MTWQHASCHPLYMSLLTEVYFFFPYVESSFRKSPFWKKVSTEKPIVVPFLECHFPWSEGKQLIRFVQIKFQVHLLVSLSSTFVSSSSFLHFKGVGGELNSYNSLRSTALGRSSFDPSNVTAAFERHQRKSLNLSVFLLPLNTSRASWN